MNPQPHESVGVMMAAIFIIGVIMMTIQKMSMDNTTINDMYDIGIVRNEDHMAPVIIATPKPRKTRKPSVAKVPKQKVEKPVVQKTPAIKPPKPLEKVGYTPLQQDCYDALIALKMGKKEAKFVVNATFNKHDINTVQEFLYTALRRQS